MHSHATTDKDLYITLSPIPTAQKFPKMRFLLLSLILAFGVRAEKIESLEELAEQGATVRLRCKAFGLPGQLELHQLIFGFSYRSCNPSCRFVGKVLIGPDHPVEVPSPSYNSYKWKVTSVKSGRKTEYKFKYQGKNFPGNKNLFLEATSASPLIQMGPGIKKLGVSTTFEAEKALEDGEYKLRPVIRRGKAFYLTASTLLLNLFKVFLAENLPNEPDLGSCQTFKVKPEYPGVYKFSVYMTDFDFGGQKAQDILKRAQKVDSVSEAFVTVKQDELKTEVRHVFTKAVSSTFTWGLNQKIGASVSAEFSAGIPLVGQAKTTVTGTYEFGANQDWTKTTTETFSIWSTITPSKVGCYKMSLVVKIAQHAKLPFTARATLSGTVSRNGDEQDLSAAAVERHFKSEGMTARVVSRKAKSIDVEISGDMVATFGVRTYTTTERISGNACNLITL